MFLYFKVHDIVVYMAQKCFKTHDKGVVKPTICFTTPLSLVESIFIVSYDWNLMGGPSPGVCVWLLLSCRFRGPCWDVVAQRLEPKVIMLTHKQGA